MEATLKALILESIVAIVCLTAAVGIKADHADLATILFIFAGTFGGMAVVELKYVALLAGE